MAQDMEIYRDNAARSQSDNNLGDSVVISKYQTAADIANAVLSEVLAKLIPGVSIASICQSGDDAIMAHTSKVYNDTNIEKGIALPTMISINNYSQYYSPLMEDSLVLRAGDLVKIELGVHIDGYTATSAHTTILNPNPQQPVIGRMADVVAAAYFSCEAVCKLLKPGVKYSDLNNVIKQVADAFKCIPVEGSVSKVMRRYILQYDKVVAHRQAEYEPTYDEDWEVEPNEAYAIDILMSTGDGKLRRLETRPTVYRRNVNETYNLKMQSARAAFRKISEKFGVFPFSLGALNERDRLGMTECIRHNLFTAYPVNGDKPDAVIAHFKLTALVTPYNTVRITLPQPLPYVHSDLAIPNDSDAAKILSTGN